MASSAKRKRNGGKFTPNRKQYSREIFLEGVCGFLVTCNNKERGALAETYDLLSNFLPNDESEDAFDAKSCSDSAAAMKAEVKERKDRKYKQVDTNVRNVLFVRLMLPSNPDPVVVMKNIFEDIEKNKKSNCRFICRMVPVQSSCAAKLEAIEQCVLTLLDKLYPSKDESITFLMNVTRRNCSHLTSVTVIQTISPAILKARPKWSVDLVDATVTVNVDILTNVACVGLVPQMKHYRRYNMVEYAKKFSEVKHEPVEPVEKAATEEEGTDEPEQLAESLANNEKQNQEASVTIKLE